jgi:dTMP kinase
MTAEMPREGRRGIFITLEGGEGAGKTTQAQLLQERLESWGRDVLVTREPGGTVLGESLRKMILRPSRRPAETSGAAPGHLPTQRSDLHPATELFLILAARSQLVAEVIRPALEQGTSVLCDRFSDSTLAYQGYGRGLELEAVRAACELATGGLRPDLSVLLDLPVDVGLARKAEGGEWDSIGGESRDFHERVRTGFRKLAAEELGRWLVVDASLPAERVGDLIWEKVRPLTA